MLWHGSYPQITSVCSHTSGCATIPNLHLNPGRYLLVLQLQRGGQGGSSSSGSRQWVDPDSGSTSPLPEWQVQVIPGADDKLCPIVQDDAYQRHFEATKEAWQQQAVAAATAGAAAAGATRPGSSGIKAGVAAAKDRAKTAQAALERHLAAAAASAEQGAAGGGANSSSAATSGGQQLTGTQQPTAGQSGAAAGVRKPAVTAAAAAKGKPLATAAQTPGSAAVPPPAAAGDAATASAAADSSSAASASHLQERQLWPGAMPAASAAAKQPAEAVIRQVKGAGVEVLQLSPADQVLLVGAGLRSLQPVASAAADDAMHSDQAGLAGSGTRSSSGQVVEASTAAAAAHPVKVLTPDALTERLQQLQVAAGSKAEAVAQAASSRGQLQAAVSQRAQQQVRCVWLTDKCALSDTDCC